MLFLEEIVLTNVISQSELVYIIHFLITVTNIISIY